MNDDDLPRHVLKTLPRPVDARREPPVLVRIAYALARHPPAPRACATCGGALPPKAELFCSRRCWDTAQR